MQPYGILHYLCYDKIIPHLSILDSHAVVKDHISKARELVHWEIN